MSRPEPSAEEKKKIKELRQKSRDEYASKPAVKILLPIAERPYLVNFIVSLTLSITIINITLYLLQFVASFYYWNTTELVNFLSSTTIMGLTLFLVKKYSVDTYVRDNILDTAYVKRCDGILDDTIQETYRILDYREQSPLLFFTLILKKETKKGHAVESGSATKDDDESGAETPSDFDIADEKERTEESTSSQKCEGLTGFLGTVPCKLYQFAVTEENKVATQAILTNIATWLPVTHIWIEQAYLTPDGQYKDTSAEGIHYVHFILTAENSLAEVTKQYRNRICTNNLNYMRHYAEHLHQLHQKGYYSNISLSNAYWKSEGVKGGSVFSFSPEWVERKRLPEDERLKKERSEVLQFGTLLLELMFKNIEKSIIKKLKNDDLDNLQREQALRALGRNEQFVGELHNNEKLEKLFATMLGVAENRPSMEDVAAVLAACYEERCAHGSGKKSFTSD